MAELFGVMAENFEAGEFFTNLFKTAMTIYGITFLFNLACLFIINKKFLYLLNIQLDDNYVMSSSSAFNDNKGTLPVMAGLMLLIPFFYNVYIIHYARILKKTFPSAKVRMPLYWALSIGVSVLALAASTPLNYAVETGRNLGLVMSGMYFIPYIPILILLASLFVCYLTMYRIMRKNFSPSYKTE